MDQHILLALGWVACALVGVGNIMYARAMFVVGNRVWRGNAATGALMLVVLVLTLL